MPVYKLQEMNSGLIVIKHHADVTLLLCRLAGCEVGSNDLLAVPPSDDPLACLLRQQDLNDMALHNPQALDYLDHRLMVTDDVRALLAVLAPWLADQQPFLLVRLAAIVLT
jgi:hypothetical protein